MKVNVNVKIKINRGIIWMLMKRSIVLALVASLVVPVTFTGCASSVRYTRHKKVQNKGLRERQRARREQSPPAQPQQVSVQQPQEVLVQNEVSQVEPPPVVEVPQDNTRRGGGRSLESVAGSYLGTPYRYGGTNRKGLDCSGFVTLVFKETYGKKLPRSSAKMFKEGRPVAPSAAKQGDLIFFRSRGGPIDHVGIYMGNKRFIHSSTSRGVIYSKMDEPYYSKRFAGFRRVI